MVLWPCANIGVHRSCSPHLWSCANIGVHRLCTAIMMFSTVCCPFALCTERVGSQSELYWNYWCTKFLANLLSIALAVHHRCSLSSKFPVQNLHWMKCTHWEFSIFHCEQRLLCTIYVRLYTPHWCSTDARKSWWPPKASWVGEPDLVYTVHWNQCISCPQNVLIHQICWCSHIY